MANAGARAYNGGLGQKPGQVRASPPEAKSSLASKSPAAEQNVPHSRYVAVHTGVNHKAFCNRVTETPTSKTFLW